MKQIQYTSWYSIIASIMMIGFLLILTTSTLNLVLQELNDGNGRQNYLKTFAGAEWGLELALLKIKQEGFWYDEDNFSWSLLWTRNLDAKIFYDFDSKVNAYTGSLDPFGFEIVPLFSIDSSWVVASTSWVSLDNVWGEIAWNIIWNNTGISWNGSFDHMSVFPSKSIWGFSDLSVDAFLWANTWSYITLYNNSTSDISYILNWNGANTYFSKPQATIFSSSKAWKYSQNLRTVVDNTEFLGVLKYSVYSWD